MSETPIARYLREHDLCPGCGGVKQVKAKLCYKCHFEKNVVRNEVLVQD